MIGSGRDDQREPQREPLFSSPLLRLDRLSTVRNNTVVLILAGNAEPQLKGPGDLLIPSWAPWGVQLDAMVLTTEPVTVPVRVEHLLTLDGEDLALVVLEVVVHLDPSAVTTLVAAAGRSEDGQNVGERLVRDVRSTVESSVRAAVGMNRAQDLRRHALLPVLRDRWLPSTLADGALVLESFVVRELSWSRSEHDLDDDDTASLERVDDGAGRLTLAPLGREDRHSSSRSAAEGLEYAHLPALISVTACSLFFVAYWVPELGTLPGVRFLLEQLAPLASSAVNGGQALVPGQRDHSGVVATILLVAGLVLAPLGRSRYWLARLALWPVSYAAAVAAAVGLLEVVVRGRLGSDLLGAVLLVVWVAAAVVTTWRSLWVDVDTLPRRPGSVGWLLGLFALLSPAPLALGRAVFAPGLRGAALTVLHDDIAVRWAALLTPVTALVYLSGLLLGIVAATIYLLVPPRRSATVRAPLAILLAALVALLLLGPQTASAATSRSEVIRTQSPSRYLSFNCGVWTQQPVGQPVQTLGLSGLSCQRVVSFRGYHELGRGQVVGTLSPVRAQSFTGGQLPGRVLAAQYGGIVVVAATDRLDHRLDALVGLRLSDAKQVWRYPCSAAKPVKLRFEGATASQRTLARRLPDDAASVAVDCGSGAVLVDPVTGRPT